MIREFIPVLFSLGMALAIALGGIGILKVVVVLLETLSKPRCEKMSAPSHDINVASAVCTGEEACAYHRSMVRGVKLPM